MTTSYISFTADVNNMTASALIGTVFDQIMTKGATEIYLLLSTPGGSVDDGIAIYNVLRGKAYPFTSAEISIL